MRLSRAIIGVFTGIAAWGLTLTPTFAATNTVTVQPGTTMWNVAKSQGISVQSVENANPTDNPNFLQVGTHLRLPSDNQSNTSGNLYWMEHVINAEAGGESLQAQIAVGDVIMHRLESGGYGNTVYDIVFQKTNGVYQFDSVPNGYIYTTPNPSSVQAAKDVIEYGNDEVPGALVFYNPSQTPSGSWVWSKPVITQIGHLVFAQ